MEAIVVKFEFTPIINVFAMLPGIVPSILNVYVRLLCTGQEVLLQDRGTIQELSDKYDFKITGHHQWDFHGLEGRKCLVLPHGNSYRFSAYIQE